VRRCSNPVEEAPVAVFEAVRSLLEEAPVPMAVLVEPWPAVEPPAARDDEVPLRLPDPDEEAPVPRAVDVEPLPAVAPPTPMLDEVPPFAP
jgi:hypothetical protein